MTAVVARWLPTPPARDSWRASLPSRRTLECAPKPTACSPIARHRAPSNSSVSQLYHLLQANSTPLRHHPTMRRQLKRPARRPLPMLASPAALFSRSEQTQRVLQAPLPSKTRPTLATRSVRVCSPWPRHLSLRKSKRLAQLTSRQYSSLLPILTLTWKCHLRLNSTNLFLKRRLRSRQTSLRRHARKMSR